MYLCDPTIVPLVEKVSPEKSTGVVDKFDTEQALANIYIQDRCFVTSTYLCMSKTSGDIKVHAILADVWWDLEAVELLNILVLQLLSQAHMQYTIVSVFRARF